MDSNNYPDKSRLKAIVLGAAVLLLSACTGLFGDVYDEPEAVPDPDNVVEEGSRDDSGLPTVTGSLYIDASSWTDWYYINLPALAGPNTRSQGIALTQQPYPIPFTSGSQADGSTAGIYTYWYDVWGKGISVNEFRSFLPTGEQPAPDAWSLAVHRNNVRTNGGGACETQYDDITRLTMSREQLSALNYTADTWTENAVWADQSEMLSCLIGSQGISINSVLSSWLSVDLPPIPPAFTHNSHVFVLRLADGTFAALQLANYISPEGTKCCLTINYKYPL